jgi:hypothetical protein
VGLGEVRGTVVRWPNFWSLGSEKYFFAQQNWRHQQIGGRKATIIAKSNEKIIFFPFLEKYCKPYFILFLLMII